MIGKPEHFQFLLSACSSILEDDSYGPPLEKSKVITGVAASVKFTSNS